MIPISAFGELGKIYYIYIPPEGWDQKQHGWRKQEKHRKKTRLRLGPQQGSAPATLAASLFFSHGVTCGERPLSDAGATGVRETPPKPWGFERTGLRS